MSAVIVVGTGPGDPAYCAPAALELIRDAQVLVGAERLLEAFARADQKQLPLGKDLAAMLLEIEKRRRQERVVVLVSGDTGLYSFATYLARNMDPEALQFVPGISSVQFMFARLKRPWQDVQILSVHGRFPPALTELVKSTEVTALLTGQPWSPPKIASYLLENGMGDMAAAVGIDLSYPGEQLIQTSLLALSEDLNNYDNAVMVIFNE